MGGRVVAHQRGAPFLVNHALDPLAALQDAAADMVEDDLADFDHVVDACHALRTDETAGICRLAAALRVKERLVEHRVLVEEVDDDRLELEIPGLFVIEFLCRGESPDAFGRARGFVDNRLLL